MSRLTTSFVVICTFSLFAPIIGISGRSITSHPVDSIFESDEKLLLDVDSGYVQLGCSGA